MTPVARQLGVPDRAPLARRGPENVLATLWLMQRLIPADAVKPWVVVPARQAVAAGLQRLKRDIPHARQTRSQREKAALWGIHAWVRDRIEFVLDPAGDPDTPVLGDTPQRVRVTEFVSDSENILRNGAADCDEFQVLAGAMALAVPVSSRPVRMTLWVGGPTVPQHVFIVATLSDGRAVTLDPTLTRKPFDTLPGRSGRWRYWRFDAGASWKRSRLVPAHPLDPRQHRAPASPGRRRAAA